MLEVKLQKNESIEKMLKRLKKKLDMTRVIRTYRAKTFYEKPSIQNRRSRLKKKYKQAHFTKENY